jgi:hypothetical protein
MTAQDRSEIVEFPQARVRPANSLPDGASAEIVIFTGVRVERLHDLAERLPPARKRTRRASATGDIEFGR